VKFYKPLIWITAGNLLICFFVFYFVNKEAGLNRNAIGLNTVIGWIFWLGIFALIAPLFITDRARKMVTESDYLGGTIVICLANLFGTMFCSFFWGNMFSY
jgi:formate-dependent nitrite reductase membrane component NrfD